MKSGIKTTEFWLALAVMVGGALAAVYQDSEFARIAGIIASSLAAAGYGWSRTRIKENQMVSAQDNLWAPVVNIVPPIDKPAEDKS